MLGVSGPPPTSVDHVSAVGSTTCIPNAIGCHVVPSHCHSLFEISLAKNRVPVAAGELSVSAERRAQLLHAGVGAASDEHRAHSGILRCAAARTPDRHGRELQSHATAVQTAAATLFAPVMTKSTKSPAGTASLPVAEQELPVAAVQVRSALLTMFPGVPMRSVTAIVPPCCENTFRAVAVHPAGTHVSTEFGVDSTVLPLGLLTE